VQVGYSIRFEDKTSPQTMIKYVHSAPLCPLSNQRFLPSWPQSVASLTARLYSLEPAVVSACNARYMTDGMLLRECLIDSDLPGYSVTPATPLHSVIDPAHHPPHRAVATGRYVRTPGSVAAAPHCAARCAALLLLPSFLPSGTAWGAHCQCCVRGGAALAAARRL
jgi:hypothetical protein